MISVRGFVKGSVLFFGCLKWGVTVLPLVRAYLVYDGNGHKGS